MQFAKYDMSSRKRIDSGYSKKNECFGSTCVHLFQNDDFSQRVRIPYRHPQIPQKTQQLQRQERQPQPLQQRQPQPQRQTDQPRKPKRPIIKF